MVKEAAMKPKATTGRRRTAKRQNSPRRAYASLSEIIQRPNILPKGSNGIPYNGRGIPQLQQNPVLQPYCARGFGADPGIYQEMLRSDGTLAGSHWIMTGEISNARREILWPKNPTPAEAEACELAERYCGLDGTEGWIVGGINEHIRAALSMRPMGFSLFELAWNPETWKGRTTLSPSRVLWRQQSSVYGWMWQGDRLAGALQLVPNARHNSGLYGSTYNTTFENAGYFSALGRGVTCIPSNQIQLYSHMGGQGNPEGISDNEPAWVWWQLKRDTLRRYEMASELYSEGITSLTEIIDPSDSSASAFGNETFGEYYDLWSQRLVGWLYAPYGYKIEHTFPSGAIPDPTTILRYCDEQMRLTKAAQMLSLDGTSSGALGGTFAQVFYNNLSNIDAELMDSFNGRRGIAHTGILRKLVDTNVRTHEGFRYPKLISKGLDSKDKRALVDMASKALQFKGVTYSAETEQWIRRAMGAPELNDEDMIMREQLAHAKMETIIAGAQPDEPTEEPEERLSEAGTQAPLEAPEQDNTNSKQDTPGDSI